MPFKFVKFTETDVPYSARVTIRRTGQLGFNAGALNLFQLASYQHVVLYYDGERRAVAIEPVRERCEGAIPLTHRKGNTYVQGKNFCERFGIDYGESRRYHLKREDDAGLLYFELDKPLNVEKEAASHPE